MGPTPPLVTLLGAPHTGAQALAEALQQRIAPGVARVVYKPVVMDALQRVHPAPVPIPPFPALTLLMGMDLPCPAKERPGQEAADAQLRTALHTAGITYQVVYGCGARRIENALIAIKKIAAGAYPTSARTAFDSKTYSPTARLRTLNCDKCSDPECEHRLFTRLTGARSAGPT